MHVVCCKFATKLSCDNITGGLPLVQTLFLLMGVCGGSGLVTGIFGIAFFSQRKWFITEYMYMAERFYCRHPGGI